MKSSLFLFLLLILSGCRPAEIANKKVVIVSEEQDEVVFMAFKIKSDSQKQTNDIVLISTTKTKAKIKKQTPSDSHSGNYLMAEIFAKDKSIQIINIAHPLYVHFEYPDDSGAYTSKDAVLEEAEFFIRFQHNGANVVRLFEILKDQPKKELLTLNL